MINFQLDLFESNDEVDVLKAELKAVKESTNKIRKALFARHNELGKLVIDMKERLDLLESNICNNKV